MFTRRQFIQSSFLSTTSIISIPSDDFSPEEIIQIIEKTELEQKFEPWTGDCINIAVAIAELFDIDAIYELGVRDETGTGHAFVSKEDIYIDGRGRFQMKEIWENWPQIERQPEKITIDKAKNQIIYEENSKYKIKTEIQDNIPIINF